MSDKTIADPLRGYGLLTATEYRNQIIQELIEKAQESETRFAAWFVQDLKLVDGGGLENREPIDQRPLAAWLKSQMEGGE